MLPRTLHISTSPHIAKDISTDTIMFHVVLALLPVCAFAIYAFGLSALMVILASIVGCVLTEHMLCRLSRQESTVNDWSAVITGILLGLTLPPGFPAWMAFFGGVLGIALGKFIFGGLGYNVFNPALVGRAILQAAFPVAITTWSSSFLPERFLVFSSSTFALPFMEPNIDGISGATPLAAWKFDKMLTDTSDLAFGLISGSTGETSALVIILGGIYLVWRGMMNWRTPLAVLGSAFLFSSVLYMIDPANYAPPMFMMCSGGLMLGAVFMATDMVASPITPLGVWIYGAIIGLLTIIIRVWGGLPEGVMYAILIANAISPHIDHVIQPRVYGTTKLKQSA